MGGIQAEVDLGATHPLTGSGVTAEVWASVDGAARTSSRRAARSGLSPGRLQAVFLLPARGPIRSSSAGAGSRPWAPGTASPATTRTTIRARRREPSAPSSERSSPVRGARARCGAFQVFEDGVTSSGSNSFQTGTTPTLGVSIAVTGSLKVQSDASDPVIELRVTGSQNQSIDCDPAIPNLADEIEQGCAAVFTLSECRVVQEGQTRRSAPTNGRRQIEGRPCRCVG